MGAFCDGVRRNPAPGAAADAAANSFVKISIRSDHRRSAAQNAPQFATSTLVGIEFRMRTAADLVKLPAAETVKAATRILGPMVPDIPVASPVPDLVNAIKSAA